MVLDLASSAVRRAGRARATGRTRDTVYDEAGFDLAKLAELMHVKNKHFGTSWHVPVDVALPCATVKVADAMLARGVT